MAFRTYLPKSWEITHVLEQVGTVPIPMAGSNATKFYVENENRKRNTKENLTWCLTGNVYFTHVACCIVSSSSCFLSFFFTFSFSSLSIAVILRNLIHIHFSTFKYRILSADVRNQSTAYPTPLNNFKCLKWRGKPRISLDVPLAIGTLCFWLFQEGKELPVNVPKIRHISFLPLWHNERQKTDATELRTLKFALLVSQSFITLRLWLR